MYRIALTGLLLTAVSGCVATCPTPCCVDDHSAAGGNGGDTNIGTGGRETGDASNGGSGGADEGHPPPDGKWINVTSNLAGKTSNCGNTGLVVAKQDEDLLFAGVVPSDTTVPWWKSEDGGNTWTELVTGKNSAVITTRPSHVVFDPDHSKTFWVSGTYGRPSIHKTEDDGTNFTALGDIDGADYVSVDLTDPERKTLLASAHEKGHTLRLSTDGGNTWEDIGSNLPANTNGCNAPLVIDSSTFLFGCSLFGGGEGGVFRSTDAGKTWSRVSPTVVNGVATAPTVVKNGDIYWTTEAVGLVRSTNQGKDWEKVGGQGGITRVSPIELPDGRLAGISGAIVASSDGGKTWEPVTTDPPFTAEGLTYSPSQKAFFVWHSDCGQVVLDNALARYDFDYTKH